MLKEKVKTYKDLVDYLDIQMILCNSIEKRMFDTLNHESGEMRKIEYTEEEFNNDGELKNDFNDYEEYLDSCDYYDIFQWYIIDESSASALIDLTDEIIFYDDELEIYVWGITHYGTSWSIVDFSNWKDTI